MSGVSDALMTAGRPIPPSRLDGLVQAQVQVRDDHANYTTCGGTPIRRICLTTPVGGVVIDASAE